VATSDQGDSVNLLQTLAIPTAGSFTFIVGTTMATMGAATETYGFASLPAVPYSVQAVRSTLVADGSVTTILGSAVQPAVVSSGATLWRTWGSGPSRDPAALSVTHAMVPRAGREAAKGI